MRFAFQTICWNRRIRPEHWPQLFRAIKAAGFAGVEVFQPVSQLLPWHEMRRLAASIGLEILGLTGGKLSERMEYLRPNAQARVDPEPYLYIEAWDHVEAKAAYDQGFTLALHYHHLSQLSSVEEATDLLQRWPNLKWLPDTAHLFVGQQDTTKLIELLRTHLARTVAVHVKDWKMIYGRFSHRYARGFCVIGQGDVGVEHVIKDMAKAGYGGWFVLELDSTSANPDHEMLSSARQLRAWDLLKEDPREEPSGVPESQADTPIHFRSERILELASRGHASFYLDLAKLLRKELKAAGCSVCLNSSGAKGVSIQAMSLADAWKDSETIRQAIERLARESIESKVPKAEVLAEFQRLAIPVENRYNPNHVRLVLVFDYRADSGFQETTAREAGFQRMVADAQDVFVTERSLLAAAEASRLAAKYNQPRDFLDAIAQCAKTHLSCEGVTVFVSTPTHNALVEGGTSGLEWDAAYSRSTQRRYAYGEGRTGKTAQSRGYSIYDDSKQQRDSKRLGTPRSQETGVTKSIDSCLIAPFFNSRDEVAGVIRCRNKVTDRLVHFFSEEDLAVVEAIMQVVEPRLEIIAEARRMAAAVALLGHEVRNPLFALRGAFDLMETTLGQGRHLRPGTFLDLNSWVDLMSRQVRQYDMLLKSKTAGWPRELSVVRFFGDVVAPVVAQSRMLLRERGFSEKRIDYEDVEAWKKNLPFLYVDRNMFEQVVFNLLSNAIKYAHRDPNLFGVRIWAEKTTPGANIYFEDHGIGVPKGWEEDIFLQFARVEAVNRPRAPGEGLGLWVVHEVIRLHGGRVFLEHRQDPTRFVIELPAACLQIPRGLRP